MKKSLIFLSFFFSSSLFAETWYGYCIAVKNEVKYCTTPEVKTDSMRLICEAFAQNLGARGYEMQFSTDLQSLEAGMGEHCEVIKGREPGQIFACQVSTLCGRSQPKTAHLASRVYANTQAAAIARCSNDNEHKIRRTLTETSTAGCYMKLVAEPLR